MRSRQPQESAEVIRTAERKFRRMAEVGERGLALREDTIVWQRGLTDCELAIDQDSNVRVLQTKYPASPDAYEIKRYFYSPTGLLAVLGVTLAEEDMRDPEAEDKLFEYAKASSRLGLLEPSEADMHAFFGHFMSPIAEIEP